jgi:hypothetical protein
MLMLSHETAFPVHLPVYAFINRALDVRLTKHKIITVSVLQVGNIVSSVSG